MQDNFQYNTLDFQPLEDVREMVGADVIAYTNEYLESMNVVNYELIMPLYFSSIGAHVLNLLNNSFCSHRGILDWIDKQDKIKKDSFKSELESIIKKAGRFQFCPHYGNHAKGSIGCVREGLESETLGFIQQFGQTPDLRVHTAYVAPPGFSKNFFMDFFLDADNGFLNFGKYGEIPSHKITTMTEASYIASKDDKKNITYGYAKRYCAGILALPEFYSVTLEGQMQHSLQMETMLLEALEKGEISKGLAGTPIKFFTHHTLWAATQPGKRFDISSGMGRRLNFLQFLPTKEDQDRYKDAQEKGYGKEVKPEAVIAIRGYLYKIWNQKHIKDVIFSTDYLELRKNWLNRVIRHTDIKLIDNVAMGYNFMTTFKEGDDHILTVRADERLKNLIEHLLKDRQTISSEGMTEMQLMLGSIKDRVISFYSLVRDYADKQLLPYDLAKERLLMAMRENLIGHFEDLSPVTNTKVTYVYSYNEYPTQILAKQSDNRVGEPRPKTRA